MIPLKQYMHGTRDTAIYPDAIAASQRFDTEEQRTLMGCINYSALELADEVGEVLGKIKKIQRDDGGIVTDAHREALAKELGDVLYPWARLCDHLGLDPEDVMLGNLRKLADRKDRGVLGGSGDDR